LQIEEDEMRLPQVVVYETDGRLAALVRPLVEEQGWLLREPRQLESCVRLLSRGGPGVLVIKLGSHLEREFALQEQARRTSSETPIILVADSNHSWLLGLGWDLGAAMVLAPPMPREALLEIVKALMVEEKSGTEA
jgi:DNA-binding response OmpR family regulator